MKAVRASEEKITFGLIPVSTLKRWCFIMYTTMHMRLTDSVSKLTALFRKSSRERKPKKENAEKKNGGKRTRGPGKKGKHDAGAQDFDIGRAMLENISSGTDAEKKVHTLCTKTVFL
jgi:hypothetical protein